MLTLLSVTPRMHTVPHEVQYEAKMNRSMAQLGSAPGLGPGGRRFESYCSDQFFKAKVSWYFDIIGHAPVAQ